MDDDEEREPKRAPGKEERERRHAAQSADREAAREQGDRRSALTAAAMSLARGSDVKAIFARAEQYLAWIKKD